MKRILSVLILVLFSLSGCDVYTNYIADKAKETLQGSLDTDTKFAKYKLQVIEIKLVSESMSKYEGIAKIQFEGEAHNVGVSVTSDFSNLLVQTKPGEFGFIFDKKITADLQELDRKVEALVDSLK